MRIFRRQHIEELTGLSRSSIYAYISEGRFPKPVKLGKRAVGWREDEVLDWIASRERASRNSEIHDPSSNGSSATSQPPSTSS